MTQHGETDETMSGKLGVTRVQVSRLRRDKSKPSPELAVRLEEVTRIPAWDFVKPSSEHGAAG
jgi:transcriptional regulator with XRE-family HTH domain